MKNITGFRYRAINNWWVFLLMGIFLIVLSIGVINTLEESFVQLAYIFSLYLFINGVSSIIFALASKKVLEAWGWYLEYGMLEVIIGTILLIYPQIDMVSLPFILGFWILFNSMFLAGTAFELRKYGYHHGTVHWSIMLYFSTVLAALAFFILLDLKIGKFTMVGWTGLSLILLGLANIVLSFKLRYIRRYALNQMEITRAFFRERIDRLKKDIKKYNNKAELDYRLDVFIAELENRVMANGEQ